MSAAAPHPGKAWPGEGSWLVPAGAEHVPGRAGWFAFRGPLDVDVGPESVILTIAADSKYWLFVNGECVVREGGLKRGPTPEGTYADTISPMPGLRPGRNQLAVLVWYFGKNGFSHRDSGLAGLFVGATGGVVGPWKAVRHPAYFDSGVLNDAFRLSESGFGYDARLEIEGWTGEGFDDCAWPEVDVRGPAGVAPWGRLEPRSVPQWFWSELLDYESVEELGVGPDGVAQFFCRLPHNAHFVPALVAASKAGGRVDVAAALDTGRIGAAFIARGGEETFESLAWMNGEAAIYRLPAGAVKPLRFCYRETRFASDFAGAFECDDPVLCSLWKKARRTLLVTMRDTFMDCPCRERAQWPGDFVVQLGQVPYCLDLPAQGLVRKALREMFRWQRPDGTLYGPVPEGNWDVELPAQMLALLSPFGLFRYYEQTGDAETLRELYPMSRRYLDVWRWGDDGLLVYRPAMRGAEADCVAGKYFGIWDWIDWGQRIDAEAALNAWMLLALDGLARMAGALGEHEGAREFADRRQAMIRAVRAAYRNAGHGGFVSAGFAHDPDDRVQALMVLGGAVAPQEYPQTVRWLEAVEQASPYMEYYVLAALFAMGAADAAIGRMRRRFRSLAENANSTLWERWPEWSTHPGTINHSWSGGPLTLLSGEAAGLAPSAPGWSRVRFRPQPGLFREFSASVKTPQGEVAASGRLGAQGWEFSLNVPPGVGVDVDFSLLGGRFAGGGVKGNAGQFGWHAIRNAPREAAPHA